MPHPAQQPSSSLSNSRENVALSDLPDQENLLPPTRHTTEQSHSQDEDSSSPQYHAPRRPALSSGARRPSYIDEEEDPIPSTTSPPQFKTQTPVTWSSLPNKGQLAAITFARLSEPLTERSLAAYMFYQLRSFDPSLSDSTISSQGGMLTAAFAAAQFCTAVWWGRLADTAWVGRKRVILVGLFGTCLSCFGVGFAKTYTQALIFRAMAGALNGNVGVLRTMISEIIKEKKYQSRAFLLLPMCFNIGVIIGPILGGFLADPVNSFPHTFGENSLLGGKDGVGWMKEWPYAFPNVVSAFFILLSAMTVIFGLDETHPALRDKPDFGRKVGRHIASLLFCRNRDRYRYTQLTDEDHHRTSIDLEERPGASTPSSSSAPPPLPQLHSTDTTKSTSELPNPPTKSKIFTRNVTLTILTHFLLALHISSFNALIFLLLPAPRYDPSTSPPIRLPFAFTGGLGLRTSQVGMATAIIGVLGFPLQILLYPPLTARLGALPAYRVFLPFSALAYATLPFTVLIPSSLVWPALTLILAAQVLSRTFSLPSMVILVNNSVSRAAHLGTVHGVAQSVSSGARTLGPVVGGWLLGLGLQGNCVGGVWWGMTALVGLNWALLWAIWEGDGVVVGDEK